MSGGRRRCETLWDDDDIDKGEKLPYNYRSRDTGGYVRERERSWSPNGSRNRSQSRHKPNASYSSMRNNSDSQTESGSHRTTIGSRYPPQRNNEIPCKYFAAGNCYQDRCKFSHVENNTTLLDDDNSKSRSRMDIEESKRRKKWDGPLWDEVTETASPKMTSSSVHDSDLNNTNNIVQTPLLTSSLQPNPHKGHLHTTDLHLTDVIDFIKSPPNSAFNQGTKAKEEASAQIQDTSVVVGKETPDKKTVGGENGKKEEESKNLEPQGKLEEERDEKAIQQFKAGLVEFVKEILKPKWKEGKMSREVYKNVVKKVVEKVTSTVTIQGSQIPTTQPKIDQYLAHSKHKITKLVEAYAERFLQA